MVADAVYGAESGARLPELHRCRDFRGVLFRDSASHDAICWSVPYSPRALSSPTQDRIAVSSLLDIAEETSRITESIATSLHSLTVGKVR